MVAWASVTEMPPEASHTVMLNLHTFSEDLVAVGGIPELEELVEEPLN
jgi:hypothetical protein